MAENPCPQCSSENTYPDGPLWVCAECSHEWNPAQASAPHLETTGTDGSVKDAHGNVLATGDSVILIKDLKLKGSSSTLKGGTKVKNIRLVAAEDGHNISCKIDGIGALHLKSEFVKKV